MKKILYTLFAAVLFTAAAQAQYVVVTGTVINASGQNIPITLSADSFTTNYITYSDSSGYFWDTIPAGSQGAVFLSYTDCNGNLQSMFTYYSPAMMVVNFTVDFCPASGGITTVYVNGSISDIIGSVDVTMTTSYPGSTIATVTAPGNFYAALTTYNITDPITVSFTDCNGVVQTQQINTILGTTVANYSGDYCDGAPNPCGQMFTASYDAGSNTFTLTMDSGVANFLSTYAWDFGDGSTSTDMYPSHVYANDGIYNVCLTVVTPAGIACTYCHEIGIDSVGGIVLRTDAGFTVNVVAFGTSTGVEQIPASTFDIYPNPVANDATVTLYADFAKTYSIDIFNAAGQHVKSFNVEAKAGRNEIKLPLADLAKGMYLMNVRFDSKTISRSFVK